MRACATKTLEVFLQGTLHTHQNIRNLLTGETIAIWIAGIAHL